MVNNPSDDELAEIRLIAEIHIPPDVTANRIDVYDWIVGIVSDWAMKAPQEPVTTSGTFTPDGDKRHNRETVIDIIDATGDIGSLRAHIHHPDVASHK